MLLLALFAVLAVSLASIGTYGVVSYAVEQRRKEIGVRIALGAQAKDVLRLVLGEGATIIAIGLVLGLLVARVSLRVLETQLYDITASDPVTFVAVAVLLMCVALLACYIPARRATTVNPIIALRSE